MGMRAIFGAGLVLLGGYLLWNGGVQLGVGTIFAYFWPSLFVIPLGLFFHWLYFAMTDRGMAGLLIPGGILLAAGVVCQIAMLFDAWAYMWPGFIAAVAIGLFEFYFFGNRNKWLLVPINILTVLSLLLFVVFSFGSILSHASGQPLIAIILVAAGVFLLIGRKQRV